MSTRPSAPPYSSADRNAAEKSYTRDKQYELWRNVLVAGALTGVSMTALSEALFGSSREEEKLENLRPQHATMAITKPFSVGPVKAKPRSRKPRQVRQSPKSKMPEFKFSSVKEEKAISTMQDYGEAAEGVQASRDYPGIYDSSWSIAGGLLAGTAGIMGGASATKKVIEKYRKWRSDLEAQEARKEYESLLRERYRLAKSSSLLEEHMDKEYDKLSKEAWIRPLLGTLGSGAITVGGSLAILSYLAAKSKSDKEDLERVRKKLLIQKLNLMNAQMPSQVTFQVPETPEYERVLDKPGLGKYSSANTGILSSLKDNIGQLGQLSPDGVTQVADIAGQAATTAASEAETGDAITSGLTKHKDAIEEGVSEGANKGITDKLQGTIFAGLLR